MKEIFNRIWELALPYQDKREDAGHAAVTLKFAQDLVELEKGDEDVIIPAIILHDVGWGQLDRDRRMLMFTHDIKDVKEEERHKILEEHQKESVKLAAEILRQVNYPDELTKEILEIISQHDTRKGFISKNEGLVRDADKLWRSSREGVMTARTRRPPEDKSHFKEYEERINKPDYFYSDRARQIALADFKLRIEEAA